jgi:hypothetical protein
VSGDAGHRARRDAGLLDVVAIGSSWVRSELAWRAASVGVIGGGEGEQAVIASGEVAFEASQRASFGLALGFFAGEVLLGGGVVVGAGDRDDVQRVVELAVAAAVEPVLGALA